MSAHKKYYICLEDGEFNHIHNYLPNVPDTIEVIEITEEDKKQLESDEYYFDVESKKVSIKPDSYFNKKEIIDEVYNSKSFLNKTDYKILRHIREKSLGINTTLSNEELLNLEKERQKKVEFIRYNKNITN